MAAPSAITNPSRSTSKGRLAVAGSSLRPDRTPIIAKAPNVSGANGASAPPAMATSTMPARIACAAWPMAIAPDAQEFALPYGRTADALVDRHVRCRRSAEDRRRQRRRDRAHAAGNVGLVLFLAEGDAAQRRSDPDPGACRIARGPRPARVVGGHPRGHHGQLAEPVQASGPLPIEVVGRAEVVNLGRHSRGEGRRVEAVDRRAPPMRCGGRRPRARPRRGRSA